MSEVAGLSRPEVVTAHEGMCVVEREHKADEAHERRVWPSPAAEGVVTASLEAPARGTGGRSAVHPDDEADGKPPVGRAGEDHRPAPA